MNNCDENKVEEFSIEMYTKSKHCEIRAMYSENGGTLWGTADEVQSKIDELNAASTNDVNYRVISQTEYDLVYKD